LGGILHFTGHCLSGDVVVASVRTGLEGGMKVLTNIVFAAAVSVGMLVAGSAYFAATLGTSAQWSGPLASGVSAGLSGMYVGSAARRRHRNRMH
jgi:hypothetical protein